MQSSFSRRAARRLTATLLAATALPYALPAEANDVGAGIRYTLNCGGLMLSDPPEHVTQCKPRMWSVDETISPNGGPTLAPPPPPPVVAAPVVTTPADSGYPDSGYPDSGYAE